MLLILNEKWFMMKYIVVFYYLYMFYMVYMVIDFFIFDYVNFKIMFFNMYIVI